MTRITTNSMTTPNRLILQGRALFFARLIWVIATFVSVGLFLLTLSIRDPRVLEYLAMPEVSQAVQAYGISIERFTYFVLIRKTLFTAIFVVVGLLLFLR